jgi:hypothetical protein
MVIIFRSLGFHKKKIHLENPINHAFFSNMVYLIQVMAGFATTKRIVCLLFFGRKALMW